MKRLVIVMMALGLSACAHLHIEQSIKAYDLAAEQVQLGQSKAQVLGLLLPTQVKVPADERKRPEQYKKDGVLIEIYYLRAAIFSDGLLTDDEFVPYVFHDGVLVGIGWQQLGGPKTQAQAQPTNTYINTGWNYCY